MIMTLNICFYLLTYIAWYFRSLSVVSGVKCPFDYYVELNYMLFLRILEFIYPVLL